MTARQTRQQDHGETSAEGLMLADLSAACADARRWDFGVPSAKALTMARKLIRKIAANPPDGLLPEVAVAEDGSVEFVCQVGPGFVTVSIPQSGARIEMVVRDTATGQLVFPAAAVTVDEVAQRLERAA